MTKEIITEIYLAGPRLDEFLAYKGITDAEKDEGGRVVVARFSGADNCVNTEFGKVGVEHRLVNLTRNREVVVFSSVLRKSGSKQIRKISIRNLDGYGSHSLTNGVSIAVKTNAGPDMYLKNQ